MYRRHPLFFGGGDISTGLSMEDREALLNKENLFAEERDIKAREFQMEMERQRKAQETEMEKLSKVQEAERVRNIEELERAAADYAPSETEAAMVDRDRRITGMWGALASSQEQQNEAEENRPE